MTKQHMNTSSVICNSYCKVTLVLCSLLILHLSCHFINCSYTWFFSQTWFWGVFFTKHLKVLLLVSTTQCLHCSKIFWKILMSSSLHVHVSIKEGFSGSHHLVFMMSWFFGECKRSNRCQWNLSVVSWQRYCYEYCSSSFKNLSYQPAAATSLFEHQTVSAQATLSTPNNTPEIHFLCQDYGARGPSGQVGGNPFKLPEQRLFFRETTSLPYQPGNSEHKGRKQEGSGGVEGGKWKRKVRICVIWVLCHLTSLTQVFPPPLLTSESEFHCTPSTKAFSIVFVLVCSCRLFKHHGHYLYKVNFTFIQT